MATDASSIARRAGSALVPRYGTECAKERAIQSRPLPTAIQRCCVCRVVHTKTNNRTAPLDIEKRTPPPHEVYSSTIERGGIA